MNDLADPLVNSSSEDSFKLFQSIIKDRPFSRKEYMGYFIDISSATASRDLIEEYWTKSDGKLTTYSYIG